MKFPLIGDIITVEEAKKLCKYFHLDYLLRRLEDNPDDYVPFFFDGVSCLPENIAAIIANCDEKKLTYKCALPHDLAYAYGRPGDIAEKRIVDTKFYFDLVTEAGVDPIIAKTFFYAVDIFGNENLKTNFSWAFASK